MRPGQNKRMRGRPTNNRRGPNPLTRSYESNGPDVKIRGNAHHVAEKYLQLARDAHTGGDPVAAENYLQHAEHYFRLIAAAQAAQALAQSGQQRPPGEGEGDDLEDDGDFGTLSDRFASPVERQPQPGFQPQPSASPNAPQPFGDRPAYEAERQGVPIAGDLLPGRIVRATDFRTAVRDLIGNSRIVTKDIETIGRDATAVRGISGPIAILSRRGKPPLRRRRRPGFRPS